jgi:hypothetical protein
LPRPELHIVTLILVKADKWSDSTIGFSTLSVKANVGKPPLMSRNTNGFVAIPRWMYSDNPQTNPFYGDYALRSVFMLLMVWAEWKDAEHMLPRQRVKLKRGQLVTSAKEICENTGLGRQATRRCLENLEITGKINQQTNHQGTIITICDYDELVGYDAGSQPTSQPTPNQRPTNAQPHQNKLTREQKNKEEGPAALLAGGMKSLAAAAAKARD